MGGAKISDRYRFLRIRFSLTSYLDQTFIPRFDRYRCFSDYFRFNGHFRLHGTILTRPMTQFNSLAINSKRNQADSLQSLSPNSHKKSDPLKKPISWTVFRAFLSKKGENLGYFGKKMSFRKRGVSKVQWENFAILFRKRGVSKVQVKFSKKIR